MHFLDTQEPIKLQAIPEGPAPDSGEVIQIPQIVTPPGKAALAAIGRAT